MDYQEPRQLMAYPAVDLLRSDNAAIQTLRDLRSLCGTGEKVGRIPKNLTTEERGAFEEVAQYNLRLEQEKVPLEYSNQALLCTINKNPEEWNSPSANKGVALGGKMSA